METGRQLLITDFFSSSFHAHFINIGQIVYFPYDSSPSSGIYAKKLPEKKCSMDSATNHIRNTTWIQFCLVQQGDVVVFKGTILRKLMSSFFLFYGNSCTQKIQSSPSLSFAAFNMLSNDLIKSPWRCHQSNQGLKLKPEIQSVKRWLKDEGITKGKS